MNKLPIILALLSAFLIPSSSYAGPAFSHNYKRALAKSKASNKPLVLIFSASWCPPCLQMKKSVYPSTEVAPYHKKFVWAYLDADKEDNKQVLAAYGVSGIPHIEFLNPNGKSIGHFTGAIAPQQFTTVLDKVLKKSQQKSKPARGSGSGSRIQ